ncbi:hypothetical protein ABTE74_21440, partial [Acinetobacter baumannii]
MLKTGIDMRSKAIRIGNPLAKAEAIGPAPLADRLTPGGSRHDPQALPIAARNGDQRKLASPCGHQPICGRAIFGGQAV